MFETTVLGILSDARHYLHERQDANRLTEANVAPAAKHSSAPLPPFTFTHPECGTELLQIAVVSEWMKVRCQIFNIQPEEDQIGGGFNTAALLFIFFFFNFPPSPPSPPDTFLRSVRYTL